MDRINIGSQRILFAINSNSGLKAGEKDIIDIFQVMTSAEIGGCNKASSTPHYNCKDEIEFQKHLKLFLKDWSSSNQLIFYFSGHGAIKNNGFCFEFGTNGDLSYLPFQNFINLLSLANVKKAIIIIDSCHSGQITKTSEEGNILLKKDDIPNGYLILSSSSKIELSYEFEDGSGSIFTSILSEALRTGLRNTKTADGFIYSNDLLIYLSSELKKEKYKQYKQSPRVKVIEAEEPIWITRNVSGILKTIEHSNVNDQKISNAGAILKQEYIDTITDINEFDEEKVKYFRTQLKPDILENYPSSLSPIEFLTNSSLMENGYLTHAGILLFGKITSKRIPSAITQCVIYFGENKTAGRDSKSFENSITEQIEEAFNFIVSRMEKFEFPSNKKTKANIEYKYPLICLREIIANALVHRDYSDFRRNTHIRLFANRIEISSPGKWNNSQKDIIDEVSINLLESQSIKRNLRLAKMISWIKQVELEGSGIPKSIQDCLDENAPTPKVSYENEFITVKIYPKKNWNILDSQNEDELWNDVTLKDEILVYKNYIDKYPRGQYIDKAKQSIKHKKEEILTDIASNIQEYDSNKILNLIQRGVLEKNDFIISGILKTHELDLLLHPLNTLDFQSWENLPALPTNCIDVFFIGSPGSGKSCLLAGLLHYASKTGQLSQSIQNISGVKYKDSLIKYIDLGTVPPKTPAESVNYLSFKLNDSKSNNNPFNFVEMSGENILKIYKSGVVSHNEKSNIKEYLNSDNKKIFFLTLDYFKFLRGPDFNTVAEQSDIIMYILKLFEHNKIFDKTIAIYIILTKVDLNPNTLNSEKGVKEFTETHYLNLLHTVKELSFKYRLSVKLLPFSIGKIKFEKLLEYDEEYSRLIFNNLVSTSSQKGKRSWLSKLFDR